MLSTATVWERRELEVGQAELSPRTYNLTIGAVLLWGLGLNALMVQSIDPAIVFAIPQVVFIIGYFVSCIVGTMIYQRSDNPVVSFAGYNLVVLPLGLLLVKFLTFFEADVIGQAFFATGAVTMGMMALGGAYPRIFLRLRTALAATFFVAFLVEIGFIVFTGTVPPLLDWVFVFIFSGYIGYDWARAQQLPRTMDNAVDAAAALYVDIVILFIRLLRILGRRR